MTEPQVTPLPKAPVGPVKSRKPVRRARTGSAASLKRKATILHSQYVRARDGRCVRCGKTDGVMHCAHIVSRRYQATRTYEGNAVCLCYKCHGRLTEHPDEHVWFFTERLGVDGYAALRQKAYDGVGVSFTADFWSDEIRRLATLLAGVR